MIDDGERIAVVAAEIGAHENLVRKWCIQARRSRGEVVSSQPAFAPVSFETAEMPTPLSGAQMCKLSIGHAVLEFPATIPPESLKLMIAAMKDAT